MRNQLIFGALGVIVAAYLVFEATQAPRATVRPTPSLLNPFESSAEVSPEQIRGTFDRAHAKAVSLVERSNLFRLGTMATDALGFVLSILVSLFAVRLGLVTGASDAVKAADAAEQRVRQDAAALPADTEPAPASEESAAAAKEKIRRTQVVLNRIKYLAAVSAILVAVSAKFNNAAAERATRAENLQTAVAAQRKDLANTTKPSEAHEILRQVDLLVARAD